MYKQRIRIVLFLIGLASVVAAPAMAQGDKDPPKAKGSFGDRDDVVLQNKRYLKVRNETDGKVTVFLQFRAPDNDVWTWIPDDPAKSTDALSFDIEAGQEVDVKYKDEPIAASRMRIWATGATQKWLANKTQDTWLVPEKTEDGEHVYSASGIETFSFVFASSKDKGVIPGDSDMVGEQSLPTEGQNIPPPVPVIPWDDVPNPLPPNFQLVRDLAVLPIFTSGLNATVRVRNLGHFTSNVGRRLMVQKVAPGSIPEDKGPIGPLFHHSVKTFFLVGVTPGNYVAFISPGDEPPFHLNDKKPFTISAAVFSDVSVLPVASIGGKAFVKVKNVGTAPVAGVRHLMIAKLPGGVPVDHGPIGPLAVNDIKAFPGIMLPAGNYKAFVSPGDPVPHQFNDDRLFSMAVATFFDRDVVSVTVSAGKATIKIKNIGTADAPAGATLKIQKLPGGLPVDHGPVGALPINAVKTFLAIPLAPGNYKAFISPGDAAPHHGNDSEVFNIPAGADLDVSVPTKVGGTVKGTIHNSGPGNYAGGARTWHIEKMGGGGIWNAIPTVGTHVIPPLGPGATHAIQGTFIGAGTYRIRITPGDANPGNDTKSKLLP